MMQAGDDDVNVGIDSIVAIPIEDFSLDYVTPVGQCVKKDGVCLPSTYQDPPDQSVLLPFVGKYSTAW